MLNGEIIKNVGKDVNAVLTLLAPGAAGSLGANKAIIIYSIVPTTDPPAEQRIALRGSFSAASFCFSGIKKYWITK